jgi:TetR/AcrR family transcriptional regulator, ethionamide resistance regulator
MGKGDERRRSILEATERLLKDRGIAELSVEEIALAAGISRPAFYFYFESKYAALAEALTQIFGEIFDAAQDFFAPTGEPPDTYMPRAVGQVVSVWEQREALAVGMIEAAGTDAGARKLWEDWLGMFMPEVAARIDQERAAGRAPAGPPSSDLARVLVLTTERVLHDHSRRRSAPEDTPAVERALSHLFLTAVWGRTAPE